MHSPSGNNLLGFSLSLITALLWGVLPVALKEIIVTMDAYTIVWYRFLVATLVIGLFLALSKGMPRLTGAPSGILFLLIIATLGLAGNYVLFSMSLNYLNAESTEAVIQLTTLFLLLGGIFVFHEPFVFWQKVGAILMVSGLVLFFNDRWAELGSATSQIGLGVLLVVVAALTWVVYALLQKHLLRHFTSVEILIVIYAMSTVLLLPLATPVAVFQLSSLQLWLLLFCCVNTVIAYGAFAEALAHWHASKVSAVLALAPLFTIATLKFILWINPDYPNSDQLNLISILAAIILVVGSAMVALVRQSSRKEAGSQLPS